VINELTGPKWLRRFMNRCFTKWPTGDHAIYSGAEMEKMLHAAGFQNIRSRLITSFTYISVGRKTAEKPAMIKLAGLSDEQVTEISRRIADAFFDYKYNNEDVGLLKLEFTYHLADKKLVPVILDTDDRDKATRYEHLGMKLDRVRSCGEQFHMYDLIREYDAEQQGESSPVS
jgi:hypothetical protein